MSFRAIRDGFGILRPSPYSRGRCTHTPPTSHPLRARGRLGSVRLVAHVSRPLSPAWAQPAQGGKRALVDQVWRAKTCAPAQSMRRREPRCERLCHLPAVREFFAMQERAILRRSGDVRGEMSAPGEFPHARALPFNAAYFLTSRASEATFHVRDRGVGFLSSPSAAEE